MYQEPRLVFRMAAVPKTRGVKVMDNPHKDRLLWPLLVRDLGMETQDTQEQDNMICMQTASQKYL